MIKSDSEILVADGQSQFLGVGERRLLAPSGHQLAAFQERWRRYDQPLVEICRVYRQAKQDFCLIDLGANIGDTAAAVNREQATPVLCVEGASAFLPYLAYNVKELQLPVEIAACFVGTAGERLGVVGQNNPGTASVAPTAVGGVEAVALERILADHPRFAAAPLLKVDTDGSDFAILEAAHSFLHRVRPAIFFEFDPSFSPQGAAEGLHCLANLIELGYDHFFVFDNFGNPLLEVPANQAETFTMLVNWLESNRRHGVAVYYLDILAIPAPDRALIPELRRQWSYLEPGLTAAPPDPGPGRGTIVIDAVFFQIAQSGIARVWETLLREWATTPLGARLLIVDRQGTAPRIPGLRYREVEGYDYARAAADRTMLQALCDQEGAALFLSTYYSTPVSTPSMVLVYDMIPEVLGWDLALPMWREKQRALKQAARFVCISAATAADLQRLQGVAPGRVAVSHCGVGAEFKVASAAEIADFRARRGLTLPYFLLVGERGAHKNIGIFFQALTHLGAESPVGVVCLGGRPELEPEFAALAGDRPLTLLRLPDAEMRAAYSGALALVYPSLYEGFGMPVVEAMACGCPVIACRSAAIEEVAGEQVLYVSPTDAAEMVAALRAVRDPATRARLTAGGLVRAGRYSWARMAAEVGAAIVEAASGQTAVEAICSQGEAVLRQIQANPYDLAGPPQLAAVRAQVATCLLAAGASLAELLAGELGKLHADLMAAGLAQLPLGEDEGAILTRISQILAQDPTAPEFLAAWAAVMLYATPSRIAPLPAVAAMPLFLQASFRAYLYTSPQLFQGAGEVESHAKYYTALLAQIRQGLAEQPASQEILVGALEFLNRATMIPLYFASSSLLEAQRHRASIVETVVGRHGSSPGLAYRFPPRPAGGRIRLGILAAHFRPQTETYATLPVYRDLDRAQFEVVLISQIGWGDHPLERYCAGHAERTVSLSQELGADVRSIRALDLDVLWIGTNLTAVMNYMVQLSVHRLARLQVVGGCCPTTTGFREVDLFVSGRDTESANAAGHYSEKLLLVEGPAHCFDLGQPEAPAAPPPSRAGLGIAAAATVFVSGANFFKIVPELLEAWCTVLRQVPNSRMILFPFNPNWTSHYPAASFILHLEAVAKAAGFAANPFLIVPPMPTRGDIVELLRLADLYLDSFPYSGMTSILEPYEAGLPLVVWEGEFQRERMAASALRALRLEEWICRSREEYVARAVRLGTDDEARARARRQLAEAKAWTPKFLDPPWFGGEIARLLKAELALRGKEERLWPS